MPAIDVSTFLANGQQYTVSFAQSGWNPIRAGVADVTSALQFIPNVKNLTVALKGGVFGLFANQYDVTFVYTGDGSDVLANLVEPMTQALDQLETLASFDFLGASTGAAGVAPNTTPGDSPGLPGLIPSSSSLWAIVIVAVLIVFVMSGGASVLRRVAA
jgi:hypothetical protein